MSEFDLLDSEPLKPLSVELLKQRSRPTPPERRPPQTAHDAPPLGRAGGRLSPRPRRARCRLERRDRG
jgi:hypothetical protein